MDEIITGKIQRMRSGGHPRVLDLFSGSGGLTLGFVGAGCESIGGVEIDEHAARTHALNFTGSNEGVHAEAVDITATPPTELMERWGHGERSGAVDIIVGGPPCPAFTRVGRAKLREVHDHPEAFRHDPRSKLYLPYLQYVRELRPVAVLMENVPDILNFGGHNLGEEVAEVLDGLGYECSYTLLNAANYGVPQMRERFILVGVHRAVGTTFVFPKPTNNVDVPSGYRGTREVALQHVEIGSTGNGSHFVPTPSCTTEEPPAVTAEEAMHDLPPILEHLTGEMRRGARRFDKPVSYRSDVDPSVYAKTMRAWPGYESIGSVSDHVIRSLSDRDYRLFRRMAPGDQYPEAHRLAEDLFVDAAAAGAEVQRADYVPPYDPAKFPNKWRKMEPDKPARTLMAHLGKDSYSHIHFDSAQARTISVREAARLQSFPDGFVFCGTMNPAFRQIGNAVPPLLATALAEPLVNLLCANA